MSATKILWGQIAVIFAVVLITMWATTQWTAWRLGARELLNKSENERSGVLSK
jgi:type IV secretion system protein VirD4